MQLKVKSQIWDSEALKKGLLDDCGPASVAAAVAWASGYRLDPEVGEVVARYVPLGRIDKQGELSAGTTFAQNIKVAASYGAKGTWAKSWAQVIAAGKAGAGIILNVQAPKGYPDRALSAWHRKWAKYWAKKDPAHLAKGYGHYVCIAYDAEAGWQLSDPTMTGKGAEALGVRITEEEFERMARGKGRAPHTTCVIITFPKGKLAPSPEPVIVTAPKPEPIVTPAPQPLAPVAEPVIMVKKPKPAVERVRDIIRGRVAAFRSGRIAK